MSTKFIAIITKYALTDGLRSVEAERSSTTDDMIIVRHGTFPSYYCGKDWTTDPTEAVKRAEQMMDRKIASLEKQLAKLRKLKFAVIPLPEANDDR